MCVCQCMYLLVNLSVFSLQLEPPKGFVQRFACMCSKCSKVHHFVTLQRFRFDCLAVFRHLLGATAKKRNWIILDSVREFAKAAKDC